MDVPVLFGPVFTGALEGFNDVIPLAVPIMVAFAILAIVLKVTGRVGVKTR